MKSATVFLVAVTVFTSLLLESSSTPIDWNSGKQVLGNIAENVGEAAKNIDAGVNNIKNIFDIILKKAGIDMANVAQGIGKLLRGVKVALKNLIEKIASSLEGEVKEKLEQALNKVGTVVVKVESLIEEIIQAIKEGADQKVEEDNEKLLEAKKELEAAVEELFAIIDELLGKVGADVAALLANVKSVVAKLVKDLETAISKLLDFVGAVIGVVDEPLKKLVYEKIQISEAALDKLIAAVKEALTKLTGAEKEALSKILEQLLNFRTLCLNIHLSLKLAVDSGNNAALQAIATIIKAAIVKTKADLAEIVKKLDELMKTTDQSNVDILKKLTDDDIKVNVQLVIEDGDIVVKGIDEVLAKRGYTAN